MLNHTTVKPFLIRGPQNQTSVVGSSVTFQCRVGGEPLPDVLWRRTASGGNMPLGKCVCVGGIFILSVFGCHLLGCTINRNLYSARWRKYGREEIKATHTHTVTRVSGFWSKRTKLRNVLRNFRGN